MTIRKTNDQENEVSRVSGNATTPKVRPYATPSVHVSRAPAVIKGGSTPPNEIGGGSGPDFQS